MSINWDRIIKNVITLTRPVDVNKLGQNYQNAITLTRPVDVNKLGQNYQNAITLTRPVDVNKLILRCRNRFYAPLRMVSL
jgi:hypothetical protein